MQTVIILSLFTLFRSDLKRAKKKPGEKRQETQKARKKKKERRRRKKGYCERPFSQVSWIWKTNIRSTFASALASQRLYYHVKILQGRQGFRDWNTNPKIYP
jgi:hypothetical protein